MSLESITHKSSGPTFAMLDLDLLRRPDISFGAKCLYARLLLYSGKDGRANPKTKTLAKDLGIEQRRVHDLLRELKEVRLIDWTRNPGYSSRYTVFPLDRENIVVQERDGVPVDVPEGMHNPAHLIHFSDMQKSAGGMCTTLQGDMQKSARH